MFKRQRRSTNVTDAADDTKVVLKVVAKDDWTGRIMRIEGPRDIIMAFLGPKFYFDQVIHFVT